MNPGNHGSDAFAAPGAGESDRRAPTLSIGLAVHNGEAHLREAIESLLAQDVEDLELIISDNDSTDSTPHICAEYSEADSRVLFSRNAANIGAAANFNRVFELSKGQYFMWGSDDDVWDPTFARRCIEKLARESRATQCTSEIVFVDEDGQERPDWPRCDVDTAQMPVELRCHELLVQPAWYGMYSVFRPAALRRTRLYRPTFGGDVCLLFELALAGDSLLVPEPLFRYRVPSSRKTDEECLDEISPDRPASDTASAVDRPWYSMMRELVSIVDDAELDHEIAEVIRDDIVDSLQFARPWVGSAVLRERGIAEHATDTMRTRRAALRSALGMATVERPQDAFNDAENPWRMQEGMRFSSPRRALLRLLQPFVDRQNALNVSNAARIDEALYELKWMQRMAQAKRVRAADAEDPNYNA